MGYMDQVPKQMGEDEKAVARRLYNIIGVFNIVFGIFSSQNLGQLLIYATMHYDIAFGSWSNALGMLFDITILYLMIAFVLNAGLLTFERTRQFMLPPSFITNWLQEQHQKIRVAIEWTENKEDAHEG